MRTIKKAQQTAQQMEALERALILAHGAREAPHFSPEWADGVMRDVRRQAGSESTLADVPHLIWRAAAVVAFVSTLFVGSVLTWTAGHGDAEFSSLLTLATADSTLLTGEP